jgi:hypothetical protein
MRISFFGFCSKQLSIQKELFKVPPLVPSWVEVRSGEGVEKGCGGNSSVVLIVYLLWIFYDVAIHIPLFSMKFPNLLFNDRSLRNNDLKESEISGSRGSEYG